MTCRFVAGGALVLAGLIKLGNPQALMLSIQGYELAPAFLIPFLAYALPWSELVIGLLLLYGAWSREAATLATALFALFTFAVISVLVRKISLDCGCFGGMFGEAAIGWHTVGRNAVFLACSVAILWKGPGPLAIDALLHAGGAHEEATAPRRNLKTAPESTP